MPRRTTTPADEGIRAATEERTAAMEQPAAEGQTATPQPEALQEAPQQPQPSGLKVDVRITSTRNVYDDPTRATATVTLGDAFVIKGFRILKGENGLFVSMPARKLRDGSYSEICHPITREFSAELKSSVLNEYQVHLAQQIAESHEIGHDLEGVEEDFDLAEPDPGPVLGGM